MVLQERWKLSKEYGIFAAPVAFLIGEDGVIERNVAKGVEEYEQQYRQRTLRNLSRKAAEMGFELKEREQK